MRGQGTDDKYVGKSGTVPALDSDKYSETVKESLLAETGFECLGLSEEITLN